jgi:hypothetical protein
LIIARDRCQSVAGLRRSEKLCSRRRAVVSLWPPQAQRLLSAAP